MTMASSISSTIDTVPHLLGDKLPTTLVTLLCSQCNLPLIKTGFLWMSYLCNCFSSLNESVDTFTCKRCGYDFSVNEIFKDKAVEIKLKRTSFPCYHHDCLWCSSNPNYRDHINNCKFAIVVCSNPSCGVCVVHDEFDGHLVTCPYKPISCQYCQAKIIANKKQEHINNDCCEYNIPCTAGCDEKIQRKELREHLDKYCKQQKRLYCYSKYGCHYKDTFEQLVSHYPLESFYHVDVLEKSLDSSHFHLSQKVSVDTQIQLEDIERRGLKTSSKLLGYRDEDSFRETQPATSYNGQLIWKIEVSQRTCETNSDLHSSHYKVTLEFPCDYQVPSCSKCDNDLNYKMITSMPKCDIELVILHSYNNDDNRVYKPDPQSELVLSSNLVTREGISSKEEMVTGVGPLTSLPFDKTSIII